MADVCEDNIELEEGEIQEQEEDKHEEQNREESIRKSRKEKRRTEDEEKGNESKRTKTDKERDKHKKRLRGTRNEDNKSHKTRNRKGPKDGKPDGKDRGQDYSTEQATSNFPNDLNVRIMRLICSSGGSMEIGKLADTMGLTMEQTEIFVKSEEGRSLMLRKENECRLAVSRSVVRLCPMGSQKCRGNCDMLHLCRFFLFGKCTRHPCLFSHEIHDDHNLKVLNMYELQELNTDELRQLLLQNDPNCLPKVCVQYNKGPGTDLFGSCAFKTNCQKLHICQYFLDGNCKYMKTCKRSHSFKNILTSGKLEKWGLSSELVPKLLDSYRNASALGDPWASRPKKKHPIPAAEEDLPLGSITDQFPNLPKEDLRHHIQYCRFESEMLIRKTHVLNPQNLSDLPGSLNSQSPHLQENLGDYISTCRSEIDMLDAYQENQHESPSREIKSIRETDIPSNRCHTLDSHRVKLNGETSVPKYDKWNGNKIADFKRGQREEFSLSYKLGRMQKESYESRKKDISQRQSANERNHSSSTRGPRLEKPGKRDISSVDPKSVPEHWDMRKLSENRYKLASLDKTSDEYTQVTTAFHKKLRTVSILSIDRIQNLYLWKRYEREKKLMTRTEEVKEQMLFHATSDSLIDTICQKNFQCGSNGTTGRKGICFSSDACDSHLKNNEKFINSNVMFMARVLVGNCTFMSSSRKSKSSFRNSASDPTTFTLYDKDQIYPEYMIKYA